MNRLQFLYTSALAFLAPLSSCFGTPARRVKAVYLCPDAEKVWQGLSRIRERIGHWVSPEADGFVSEEELTAAERQLLQDLYDRHWEVYIDQRAYMIEGLAWVLVDNQPKNELMRVLSPNFTKDIQENPNVFYHMLKALRDTAVAQVLGPGQVAITAGAAQEREWAYINGESRKEIYGV